MIECRCAVLNHLSGAIAADYVRTHLHSRGNGGGTRTFTCPDTGVRWADDSGGGTDGIIERLRRQEY